MPSYDLAKSLSTVEVGSPSLPTEWNYDESVKKIRDRIFKWKTLTSEMLTELWVAKSILKKSKSDAAKISRGVLTSYMTWSQYCEDIGCSVKTVNKWLQRKFGDGDSLLLTQGRAVVSHDPPVDMVVESAKVMKLIKRERIEGAWNKRVLLDLHKHRNRKEWVDKLVAEKIAGRVEHALVTLGNQFMGKDWFGPLYDDLVCISGKNCICYLGSDRKAFIKAFSGKGVILRRQS